MVADGNDMVVPGPSWSTSKISGVGGMVGMVWYHHLPIPKQHSLIIGERKSRAENEFGAVDASSTGNNCGLIH